MDKSRQDFYDASGRLIPARNPQRLRFLIDGTCDFLAVRALRAPGHDVSTVAQVMPGADEVMAVAERGPRILTTEDRNFSQIMRRERQTPVARLDIPR